MAKVLWFLATPSNLLPAIGGLGVVLMLTRLRRMGLALALLGTFGVLAAGLSPLATLADPAARGALSGLSRRRRRGRRHRGARRRDRGGGIARPRPADRERGRRAGDRARRSRPPPSRGEDPVLGRRRRAPDRRAARGRGAVAFRRNPRRRPRAPRPRDPLALDARERGLLPGARQGAGRGSAGSSSPPAGTCRGRSAPSARPAFR